nr:hypothetical protein Iba_chr05cCG0320 [Ipomoea batatas]
MKRSELSQRYSDEDDLLERSTKKSKERGGLDAGMDLDPAVGSPSSMASALDPYAFDEAIAETPILEMPGADPMDPDMQTEAVSPPLSVDQDQQDTHRSVDSGNAAPKTYLDSVIGKGTDAAPFLIDNEACSASTVGGAAAQRVGSEAPQSESDRAEGASGTVA